MERNRDESARSSLRISVTFNQLGNSNEHQKNTGSNLPERSRHDEAHDNSCHLGEASDFIEMQHPNQRVAQKKFRFVLPQNHKSALFVNLGDSGERESQAKQRDNLFVSPDLNQIRSPSADLQSTPSPPSRQRNPSFDQACRESVDIPYIETCSHKDMGDRLGCFCFVPSMAQRRRSASVSPPNTYEDICTDILPPSQSMKSSNSERSLSEKDAGQDTLTANNGALIERSNETICANTNRRGAQLSTSVESNTHLEYCIIGDSEQDNIDYSERDDSGLSEGLEDFLNLDSSSLEEECQSLEEEIESIEQRVADIERGRLSGSSRTLVDQIIRQRRQLRDLEMEIFECKLRLNAQQKAANLVSPTDIKQFQVPKGRNNLNLPIDSASEASCSSSSSLASPIKPGIENTADILDAVPPPAQLQRGDILNRTSNYMESGHLNPVNRRSRRQYRK